MEMFDKLLTAPWDFFRNYGGPFILVLSVLVFVHEWGHYIVARFFGVKVENFSIGFGKELFGWNDKNGTRWKVSLIPLGGYVQMFGDVDPASASHAEGVKEGDTVRKFTEEERKVAFFTQSVGRRAAIVFAGPAINYIFAIIILTGLFAIEGQPYTPAIVKSVVEGSPAAQAGIQPDDKIIEVDGVAITKFQDLTKIVMINLDKELEVKLVRYKGEKQWHDEPVVLNVKPKIVVEEDRFGFRHSTGRLGLVGHGGASEIREHTLTSAMGAALFETYEITANTLKALGQMVMGYRSTDELGGIIRIGAYAGEFAQAGLISLITFSALLSINLGLVNLLPIPMLDGGHLMFYAMETVRGKPLGERFQEYSLRIGVMFLMGVMLFATWNDLVQLKVVDYVKNLIS